jgi:carboxylesterase
VEDGYHLLCNVNKNIFFVGLSMGAILSLLLATQLRVKGVIAMSTPARLPSDYPIWLMELMSLFVKDRPKTNQPPGSGWFDKEAYREHIAYPRNPVRSAAELKKLIREMHRALPRVRVPVLLMHSRDERYVLLEDMETIYAGLANTPDKTKLYITGSGHVLPRDASREQVFTSALAFIQRVCTQSDIGHREHRDSES